MYTIEETMKKCLTKDNVFPYVNDRPDAILRAQTAMWVKLWRKCIRNCSGQKHLLYPGLDILEEAFMNRGLINLYYDSLKRLWVELENSKYCFEVSSKGRLSGFVYNFDIQWADKTEIDMQVMDVVHFSIAFDSMIPDIDDAVEKLFFQYEIEQKVKQIEEITYGKCKR